MIQVTGLRKSFAGTGDTQKVWAVDDVSFDVPEGGFVTLLGPSGCGKTTTLRCVAGLEDADAGRIEVDGISMFESQPLRSVPAHRRKIGMVFQSYAIWPHMTVFENVAFPLRVARERLSAATLRGRVHGALATVGLDAMHARNATQLSGGQQQRLALARALVTEPRVLLLDEPLSNLDAKLREEMRAELQGLQARLKMTTLYVTHDQVEALAISDRIAVMNQGRIEQFGSPRDIYDHPATMFVADFVGAINFFPGIWTGDGVRTAIGHFSLGNERGFPAGAAVRLAIRPEDVVLRPLAGANAQEGVVTRISFLGELAEVALESGAATLRVRGRPRDLPRVGERLGFELPPPVASSWPTNPE